MTKITLTWQEDAQHKKPYNEEIELAKGVSFPKISTEKFEPVVTSENKPENPYELAKLERSVISVALDNCIEQLSIIKYVTNENVPNSWYELFEYKTLSERFKSTPKKEQQFYEEEYENIPYTAKQKLQKDVCFLISILTEVCREVSAEGVSSNLLKVLDGLKREEDDNARVETLSLRHEVKLDMLQKQLANEKKKLAEKLEKTKGQLGELKNETEDIFNYGKQEMRYVEDWEKARTHQQKLRLTEEEEVYQETISKYLTKIEYENRIHNEIRNYIEENTEDLQDSINYWMQHYDDEVERRDAEIIKLKMTWEQLTEHHRALRQVYEERAEFIEHWLEVKEKRRKQEELERLQNWAATKIQAWWRGVMVRKKFGPFRPKKGKGKKGDKKGGGKGGKKKK